MKLPCSVIQDLLPLYCDSACSPESRALINEHLNECEDCRRVLTHMHDEIELPKEKPDPTKPLLNLRTEWLRTKTKALLKGMIITLLVVGILIGGWFGATELKFPVDADKLTISDVSMLSNGVIAFHLLIDDDRELRRIAVDVDFEDGVAYITPKRALIEQKRAESNYLSLNDKYYYIAFAGYTLAQFEAHDYESMTPIGEDLVNADYFFASDIKEIRIGTKNSYTVLWKQGMELSAASEDRETIFASGIR